MTYEQLSQTLGLVSADLKSVIVNIINFVLGLLAFLQLLMILYAGFLWFFSRGNEEMRYDAKIIVIRAIVGSGILALAWAIVNFLLTAVADWVK
ncbi:hypothetical protein C4546_03235 [Candidatus Parcubacteria bacterium]|jgi:hypothetical protein|nr:MAG: hypothetical protein C4546_03235 [Candidatus Parcubacteria bacterium]